MGGQQGQQQECVDEIVDEMMVMRGHDESMEMGEQLCE